MAGSARRQKNVYRYMLQHVTKDEVGKKGWTYVGSIIGSVADQLICYFPKLGKSPSEDNLLLIPEADPSNIMFRCFGVD